MKTKKRRGKDKEAHLTAPNEVNLTLRGSLVRTSLMMVQVVLDMGIITTAIQQKNMDTRWATASRGSEGEG